MTIRNRPLTPPTLILSSLYRVDARAGWIGDSELLRAAFDAAAEAHSTRGTDDTTINHPLAVAELLHSADFSDHVVAAALLHDVIEDTSVDIGEIASRFGPDITLMVADMTEDEAIDDYAERKAEHRDRMTRDRRVAAIYAADKLASSRYLDSSDDASREQLDHYRRTLEVLTASHPELPFIDELARELDRLCGET